MNNFETALNLLSEAKDDIKLVAKKIETVIGGRSTLPPKWKIKAIVKGDKIKVKASYGRNSESGMIDWSKKTWKVDNGEPGEHDFTNIDQMIDEFDDELFITLDDYDRS